MLSPQPPCQVGSNTGKQQTNPYYYENTREQVAGINAQVVFGNHQRPDAACGSDGPDHKPNEQTVGSTRLFNYHANHSPSNHRHGKRNP